MKDYTLTLNKILGKEKYEELAEFTFKKVEKKFGDIKSDKATKIGKVNHQALLIISTLKAMGTNEHEIINRLHWKKQKAFKFIIGNSYGEFTAMYKEYIRLIIDFLKGNTKEEGSEV